MMKKLTFGLLLMLGLMCSCSETPKTSDDPGSTQKNKQEASSHSHDGEHGHSHGAGGNPDPNRVILDAAVVKATKDSPEYIQLANHVEVIEDVAVAASSESSVFTHEGYFGPLLFGEELRAFSLKLEPGMFLAEHGHPTESIVYTIQGRWVLCSEGKRQVMQSGSIFHFGSDMPTGWEAPFAEGALILIFKKKKENENYQVFTKGTRALSEELDQMYKKGDFFYYHQLPADHPAIVFAKEHNPDFETVLANSKK